MNSVFRARFLRHLVRPLLVTSFGTTFAGVVVWSAAGMVAMSSSFVPGAGPAKPELYFVKRVQSSSEKAPRLVAAKAQRMIAARAAEGHGKSDRLTNAAGKTGAGDNAARFDAIVKEAQLTSEKLGRLFNRSGSGKVDVPVPERFAPPAISTQGPPTLLAYADPSPSGANAALSALLSAPVENGLATLLDPEFDLDIEGDAAALPDYGDTPSDVPLPEFRPEDDPASKPSTSAEKPEPRQTEAAPKAVERGTVIEGEAPKQEKLAYARPDNPAPESGSLGRTLRNLFGGGTRARNDIAVYDISAARVYMPDGSVLEAHSGVGKMADDPRYVHVKMSGPTPPHTYNLQMREKRFYGVEAIRMLPVDGKNKHGRDGFLTHSYLLRGGRAESHGCVAFKDYDRFLNAFKQGKVKQLIVVPSGGRATMLASNGKSI